ncbi:hypothetical protein [Paenibacillus sp. 481]|uniref:hypothetical protein n=1 Tax=Paenibacillus sp. 481 TaxID=2835869 RepID=UPI001E3109F4|nr:hypothetical protein [Paenibacillus sp. 481]UHA75486.1 hypothetical protein KIK04_11085 [Paenibacillus sp. 481]
MKNRSSAAKWLLALLTVIVTSVSVQSSVYATASSAATEADLELRYDCSSTATKQMWTIKNPTAKNYVRNGAYWVARNHVDASQARVVKDSVIPSIPAGSETTVEFDITKWGTYSGKNVPTRMDIANRDYKSLQYVTTQCEREEGIIITFEKRVGTKSFFTVTNYTNKVYKGQWYAFGNNNKYANDGWIMVPGHGKSVTMTVNYWNVGREPLTKVILSDGGSGWLGANKAPVAQWRP